MFFLCSCHNNEIMKQLLMSNFQIYFRNLNRAILPSSCLFIDFPLWNIKTCSMLRISRKISSRFFHEELIYMLLLFLLNSTFSITKLTLDFVLQPERKRQTFVEAKKVNRNLVKHQRLMISVSKVSSFWALFWMQREFVECLLSYFPS